MSNFIWTENNDGFWDLASNWQDNLKPGATSSQDDVLIDIAESEIIATHRSGTTEINNLIATDKVVLSGGNLVLNGSNSSLLLFDLTAGTLTQRSNLIVTDFNWNGGILTGGGTTTIQGDFNLSNTTKDITGQTIITQGETNWDSGTIRIYGSQSQWTNTGTFNIIGARFIDNFNPVLIFDNQGTINKTDTGTATLEATVNNNGLINVESGILYITGNSNHTGDFTIAENARLQVTGNHNFDATSNIMGVGDFRVVGNTTNLDGNLDIGGDITVSGGTLNVNQSITSNQLITSGGTLNINAEVNSDILTQTSGTTNINVIEDFTDVAISGGTFNSKEETTITDLDWTGGIISGRGKLTITD